MKLADQHDPIQGVFRYFAHSLKNGGGNGKVKAGALFPYITRRKIDRDSFGRKQNAQVAKCGADTVLCLPYLGGDKTDHRKNGHAAAHICFYPDGNGIYAVNCGRENTAEHKAS